MRNLLAITIIGVAAAGAQAAVVSSTVHGAEGTSLDGMIATGDLISGLVATELPGDNGWHGATPPEPERLQAITDDGGQISGLTGLMNDFPGVGTATKLLQYNLAGPSNIASIGILTGNNGKDGRVFSTSVIRYSTDNGGNWNLLGYFQSDPSGTINSGTWGSTYVNISDDASATLLPGVTNLIFELYAVDNTGGQMRDPFDGVNPFTSVDDGLSAAFVSPLIWEIDVVEVPEPAAAALLALGGLFVRRRRVA